MRTKAICFWCVEARGDYGEGNVAEGILDYDPCDKCKTVWETGVLFIEISDTTSNPPLVGDMCPTGRWLVLNRKAVVTHIQPPEIAEAVADAGQCMIERPGFEMLLLTGSDPPKTVH